MKFSITPTPHILVLATTNCKTDQCDFAIIEVTESRQNIMQQRFSITQHTSEDMNFHNLAFWENPLGFFRCAEDSELYDELQAMNESWAYIELYPHEQETFLLPKSSLDTHQVIIYDDGTCVYKAYGKHNGDEFFTETFNFLKIAAIGK